MAEHSTPIAPEGLLAEAPGRVGGAARGWPGLGRLLADRWGGEVPVRVVQLWAAAQAPDHLGLGARVRAATAADPFLR